MGLAVAVFTARHLLLQEAMSPIGGYKVLYLEGPDNASISNQPRNDHPCCGHEEGCRRGRVRSGAQDIGAPVKLGDIGRNGIVVRRVPVAEDLSIGPSL